MEGGAAKPKHSRKTPKKTPRPSNTNLCSQELKDKEAALRKELSDLNHQIEILNKEGVTTDVSEQMKALHDYNETRDIASIVLNYLSNATNESIVELHKKYDLPLEE